MSDAPKVWINGELLPADEVRVSPFDLGLTVGLGVFETMVAYQGKVFAYDLHHRRLEASAEVLGIAVPEQELIEKAMNEVIGQQDIQAGRLRVRVSLSGGNNALQGGDQQGNLMVSAVTIPVAHDRDLAKLVQVPFTINEHAATSGLKSASYADHVLAYRYALKRGGDEALMLNTRGEVCEAAMSNLFVVKDGVVKTPALSSGCLAGVTRELIIRQCLEHNLPVQECDLVLEDVHAADELFLTSSVRELQGAVLMGDERDQHDTSGEITRRLSGAYTELVRKELGL